MGKSYRGGKSPGFEYWGERPESRNHGLVPGRSSKTRTHRLERIEAKEALRQQTTFQEGISSVGVLSNLEDEISFNFDRIPSEGDY